VIGKPKRRKPCLPCKKKPTIIAGKRGEESNRPTRLEWKRKWEEKLDGKGFALFKENPPLYSLRKKKKKKSGPRLSRKGGGIGLELMERGSTIRLLPKKISRLPSLAGGGTAPMGLGKRRKKKAMTKSHRSGWDKKCPLPHMAEKGKERRLSQADHPPHHFGHPRPTGKREKGSCETCRDTRPSLRRKTGSDSDRRKKNVGASSMGEGRGGGTIRRLEGRGLVPFLSQKKGK